MIRRLRYISYLEKTSNRRQPKNYTCRLVEYFLWFWLGFGHFTSFLPLFVVFWPFTDDNQLSGYRLFSSYDIYIQLLYSYRNKQYSPMSLPIQYRILFICSYFTRVNMYIYNALPCCFAIGSSATYHLKIVLKFCHHFVDQPRDQPHLFWVCSLFSWNIEGGYVFLPVRAWNCNFSAFLGKYDRQTNWPTG